MKFLLIALVLVGAYFGFRWWTAEEGPSVLPEEESAEELAEAAVQAAPVDFPTKVRVRRVLEEWKRRSLEGSSRPRGGSIVDIRSEVSEIRRRLHRDGLQDEGALEDLMVRAAVELGYAPDQAGLMVRAVLSESRR